LTEKRLVVLILASLGFVSMLAGLVAARSHCRTDCKEEIAECLALVPSNKECTGTRAEKRACRKTHAAERKTCRRMVKLCKELNPSASGICVPTTV
jgi:hypothetical protein